MEDFESAPTLQEAKDIWDDAYADAILSALYQLDEYQEP